jgi:YidC/Oxa1 family membrane protein insertase
MPVIFTFMFINFPSGLVLYWLVNNVLSIGQQYRIIKRAA